MADIKISQLGELATTPADSDVLVINDVSVSTTKQITVSNLFGNLPTNVVDSDTGAKVNGPFQVVNNLSVGGDIDATGTLSVGTLSIDEISTSASELTIDGGTGTTLKVGGLDINTMGNLDGSGISVSSNISLGDDNKLRVGDAGDGQFYHDGSNTYLDEGGAGSLIIRSNGAGIILRDKTNGLNFLNCQTSTGETRLFYNGGGSADLKGKTFDSGFDITGFARTDLLRVTTPRVPSSASDTGKTGEIAWDADYIYICTTTDTWKRVAISTWP